MKQFKIYEHDVTKQLEAVKVGFCWPAFFLNFIYALVKKNWALAGIMFISSLVVGLILQFLLAFVVFSISSNLNVDSVSSGANFWSSLLIQIFWGVKFNSLYESGLLKNMFKLKDTLSAPNRNTALMLYMGKK